MAGEAPHVINIITRLRDDASAGLNKFFDNANKRSEELRRNLGLNEREHQAQMGRFNEEAQALEKQVATLRQQRKELDMLQASNKRVQGEKGRFLKFDEERLRLDNEINDTLHKQAIAINGAREEQDRYSNTIKSRTTSSVNRLTNSIKKNTDAVRKNDNWFSKLAFSHDETSRSTRKLEQRLARLGRAMLGLVVASVVIFMHTFVSVLAAAAGEAVALAGSLTYAAGALGGTFVAAVAQAIPVVGLLVAAMQRLSIIQDAVNQHMLIQKQAGGESTQALDAQKTAADGAADAQRGVANAQRDLTEARSEARKEVEDLILAEREAKLAMEDAIISQTDARRSLRDAVQEGDIGGIDSSRLQVRQSNLGVDQARVDLRRASHDADQARAGGVEGMDRVKEASRALADANRSLADSHEKAAAAADDQSAAEGYLDYYLKQLTPTERRLYDAIVNLRERFQKELTPITDILIGSFVRGINRVEELIFDNRIIRGFTELAKGVADAIDRITGVATNQNSRNFWVDMLREGRRNLEPITDIAINLWRVFKNIAESAAPVLHKLLGLIADETERWVDSTRGRNGLTQFFEAGLGHLRAWWGLLKSVLGLWSQLMIASGAAAGSSIESLTNTLNNAANALRWDNSGAKEFFEKSAEASSYLGDVIVALGEEFVETFMHNGAEGIKGLRDVLLTLIPAIGDALKWTSQLSIWLARIVDLPIIGDFIQLALTLKIVAGSVGLLVRLFIAMISPLRVAAGAIAIFLGLIKDLGIGGAIEYVALRIAELSTKLRLLTMGSIIGLVVLGLALLGDALGLFGDDQEDTKVKVQDVTNALDAQKDAVRALRDSYAGIRSARLQVQSAELAEREALREMNKARQKYGEDSHQYREAENRYKQAILATRDARKRANDAEADAPGLIRDANEATKKAIDVAGARIIQSGEEVAAEKEKLAGYRETRRDLKDAGQDTTRVNELIDESQEKIRVSGNQAKQATEDFTEALHDSNISKRAAANLLDRLNDNQKDVNDATKKGTDRQDEQKDSLKGLRRGFAGLIDTLFGTGKQSRDLGTVFKEVTNKVLKAFGADELKFDIPSIGKAYNAVSGIAGALFASGGWIGNPWDRGADDRLIGVAGGEAVLTGHQQQAVNMALAYGSQAGVIPFRNLDDLFNKDRRPHSTAKYQGFAKGGKVGRVGTVVEALGPVDMPPFSYDPSHAGSNRHLHLAMSKPADIVRFGLMLRRLGYQVSENALLGDPPAPGVHSATGYHYTNQAIDINTANDETLAEIRRVVDLLGGASVEGIGGARGAMGGAPPHLKRLMIRGPKGPLKNQLQEQSDKLREAVNKKFKKLGGAGISGVPNVPTGPIQKMARQMVLQMWGPSQWPYFADLEMREAGWNPRALNASSGAAGLAQALPASKYPPGAWPYQGPESAKLQLQWMMQYIKDTYGDPAGAIAHHNANNWYQRGGGVPEFDQGGVVPGPLGTPQFVKAHGGEVVLPTHKFQQGGKIQGVLKDLRQGVSNLRGTPIDKFVDRITELLRDGGILDDIATEMDAFIVSQTRKLNEWAYRVRHGLVGQVKTTLQMAGRSLDDLEEQGRLLNREMDELDRMTASIRNKLRNAEKNEDKQKLRTALNNLQDRADTLGDAIAQNLVDRLDAQRAIFDAAIARFEQRIAFVDSVQRLAELRAELSGNPNLERLQKIFERRGDILRDERHRLQQELRTARRTRNTELERELRQALMDNRIAILENTKSLKETNGTLGEVFDFNSTPWQIFRQAVLNGMGGVLPGYSLPGVNAGPSFVVSDASAVVQGGNGGNNQGEGKQEININIDEPMEVADPIALSNAIAFKMKQDKTI